ncbi:hypothetical protein LCGC14_1009300 [marine sediment metagenome]|uniref:Uncharacterized protein n=1 Tax=marine sediment metagenome TaxID=412755 RepID=A0A0F9QIY9_9ZZZZ|nr:hypothetical protein [Candidatus Aminicenantes bacterium]
MIRTSKKMRNLYAKHLNKLYDYADEKFNDDECYLCSAANQHPKARPYNKREFNGDCNFCPLTTGDTCASSLRHINLRRKITDVSVSSYNLATPDSIRKHAQWIEKQIIEKTDCEFYWTTK